MNQLRRATLIYESNYFIVKAFFYNCLDKDCAIKRDSKIEQHLARH